MERKWSADDIRRVSQGLESLARAMTGEVVVRSSPAYDQLPRPFNARFDHLRPLAVVRCTSAEDVAETIAFLRRHVRVAGSATRTWRRAQLRRSLSDRRHRH